MGQRIVVETRLLGDVAVLIGDRSLTGQDGESFSSPDDAEGLDTPASTLARRLFADDPAVEELFAQSNVVTLTRAGGWDEASLAGATESLEGLFVHWDGRRPDASTPAPERIEELRAAHYNATISSIRKIHETLWIMDVSPDGELPPYQAGQYATLGLGFWEPRVDGADEGLGGDQMEKLALRSYSISSSILDADGNLLDPESAGSLEFYVVLVETEAEETPAVLTPRLFGKDVGDRLFLGRKMAGRYRLDRLTGDDDDVVFLATGTGEAPHNRMVLDLLRRDHRGRIVSVCTARYRRDLAYLDVHEALMERYPSYRYVPMTTREPENEGNKVYIQDFIESGGLEEALGKPLDPTTTHVFLCGNPAMIGLPTWEGDTPTYPEVRGAVEILAGRGFTVDRRGVAGNVHYEEYW